MKTIYTVLRDDFGRLDRNLVRSELLSERGVKNVSFETARNGLSIEYDPAIIADAKVLEIMRRYGVFPDAAPPRRNSQLVKGSLDGEPRDVALPDALGGAD
jgi:hypothetical protein